METQHTITTKDEAIKYLRKTLLCIFDDYHEVIEPYLPLYNIMANKDSSMPRSAIGGLMTSDELAGLILCDLPLGSRKITAAIGLRALQLAFFAHIMPPLAMAWFKVDENKKWNSYGRDINVLILKVCEETKEIIERMKDSNTQEETGYSNLRFGS